MKSKIKKDCKKCPFRNIQISILKDNNEMMKCTFFDDCINLKNIENREEK